MTSDEDGPTNVARDQAHVGIQAETIHGDVHLYQLSPDPTPQERYDLGVRYLEGGAPRRARELIHEAVVAGLQGNEVSFYWLLAFFSGRTKRQLSDEDLPLIEAMPRLLRVEGDDDWARGVRLIGRLLESFDTEDEDTAGVIRDLDDLAELQRRKILGHLERFLARPLQDKLWAQVLQDAENGQHTMDREQRVWKFFEAKPALPRVRHPQPIHVTRVARLVVGAGIAVAVAAVTGIGAILLHGGGGRDLVWFAVATAGFTAWMAAYLEWRYRNDYLERREAEHLFREGPPSTATPGGFTAKVDGYFDRYVGKYALEDTTAVRWLVETTGVCRTLRDEIVEVYREQRVSAESVKWLVRHYVRAVRRRWADESLFDYRTEFRTPLVVKAAAWLGGSLAVIAGTASIVGAVQADLMRTSYAVVIALGCGGPATKAWIRLRVDRQVVAREATDAQRRLAEAQEAYHVWLERLADRPTDLEMAHWLECDRKVLLNDGLKHYRLKASSVIAHAFLEAPGARCRRARVWKGPWRYSRYTLLVFLLTRDGVRQIRVELDFETTEYRRQERSNYRFDAVAAVHVEDTIDKRRLFELGLLNGQCMTIDVMGPGTKPLEGEPPNFTEITLDAAGLYSTLDMLEGVAAEGKGWVSEERERGEMLTKELTEAVGRLLS
jgi:hypothetical protein